jgi:glycosyltransferase involved in cell wall biosynthesis
MSAALARPIELEPLDVRPPAVKAARRVLHLINGEHYSGAERVQDLLAAGLGEFGFHAAFACLKHGRFAELRQSQGAPLFRMPMRHRFDVSLSARVAAIVRDEGFCLLHAHTPRALIIGGLASRLSGVPLLYHVHSPAARDSHRRFRNRLNAWVERRFMSRAAGFVAVSESLGRELISGGIDARLVSVVHNGVPTQGPLVARKAPTAGWTLGSVALFRPRKGLELLLEAIALLRADGLPVELRAVGPFESRVYEHDVHRRVDRLGLSPFVTWTGFTHDVAAELARMDLFVLPSLYGEGLPMVVLEAMAAGVPVVATRVEGVPEAVRDGIDGLLAPPGDTPGLARTILQVIRGKSDWQALRQTAHARQSQYFSDRSMARGVARAYERILGPG